MKKIFTTAAVSIVFLFLFGGWGGTGHTIINKNIYICLPSSMNLPVYWSDTLTAHASDADKRKSKDNTESPRHFIDIDFYPEFVSNGYISQSYDTNVLIHGSAYVIKQGTLPWAITKWKDSLTQAFKQLNWHSAMMLAADVGHYVGDGHQPLHCTANYDGGLTNQSGVHSRYESDLVGQYQTSIVYSPSTATYVSDVSSYTFNFIYITNKYVDSTLHADSVATAFAGSNSGTVYLTKYWELCGNQIIQLMKTASRATADLIYTAWIDGGSPGALPVELTSFISTIDKNNVTLNWSTATEINNFGYNIERKSINSNWEKIAFIKGNGNSSINHNYIYTDKNLVSGNYDYRLAQMDFNGTTEYHNLQGEVVVSAPSKFELSQNYPNPFNPATSIKFNIPVKGNVSLKVFNLMGKVMDVLFSGEKEAGNYEINYNASKLASGVYFYELRSAGFAQSKKMILMK